MLAANDGKVVKVVGITSYETDAEIQDCLNAGMSAVISKPVNVARLQSAFNAHYEQ